MTRLKAMTAVSEKMNFLSIFLILSVTGCYRSNDGLWTILRPRIRPLPQGIRGTTGILSQNDRPDQVRRLTILMNLNATGIVSNLRDRVEAGAVTMPLGFDTAHNAESAHIYWPTSPGLSSAVLRA